MPTVPEMSVLYLFPLLITHDLDAVLQLGEPLVRQPLLLLDRLQGLGKAEQKRVGTLNSRNLVKSQRLPNKFVSIRHWGPCIIDIGKMFARCLLLEQIYTIKFT